MRGRLWVAPGRSTHRPSPPSMGRVLCAGLAILALAALGPGRGTEAARLDAAEILRRSEEVRAPDADYAVEFSIGVMDDYTPGKERKGSYSMIAHGKNQTMILMLTPEQFYGGTLLMQEGAYWLLLPRASHAYQLSREQVIRGDVANGDLARSNLQADFDPSLDGEETVLGEPCWRLDLKAKPGKARYSRIRCWIAKKRFLPRKFEYYGMTGVCLKTAYYEDYRKTPLGFRSMKMVIDSPEEGKRRTTMIFSDLRKVDASPIDFTPEGMVAFRDAALAKQQSDGSQARPEDVIARLASAKS